MSDEPVEDGDSGSDAEGASSSTDSDQPDEDPSGGDDRWTWDEEPQPTESADDGDDGDDVDDDSATDDPAADDSDSNERTGDAPDAADAVEPPADDDSGGDAAVVDDSSSDPSAGDDGADDDADSDTSDVDSDASDADHDAGDARDGIVPTSATGRPRYTDDHVTASNGDSEGPSDAPAAADPDHDASQADDADDSDAASKPVGADTNPGDHAPIGTQAPSPDEGPSTAVTDTAGAGGGGGGSGSSILSGGIGGTAPPDDEEMPLTEHIEEMLTRLAVVVVIASLATLVAFPFANDVIIQMWYDVHNGSVAACQTAPQSDGCVAPHVYGPLELVLTRIRVAGLVGLLVALPLAVYQIYRFMRPGLYPHERRYYLAAVPFSLVLGIVGMTFAYFVLLPLLFEYFITYTEGSADLAFQLAETMNLILLMMGMLAIIFQIPLLIMLAILMGITTRRWLERRRLYFWGLFLGVAVIFGPDPTGMAPFLLTATMVALFEGTLLLLRWTGR